MNALVDYSVQIEGVTLAFMTLLGLGVAQEPARAETRAVLKRVENVSEWERAEADAEAPRASTSGRRCDCCGVVGVSFWESRRWRSSIGALYLATETPLYVASAQLLLEPLRARAAGLEPTPNEVAMDVTQIESQIAILKSTSLLARVVRKERLFEDPEYGAGARVRGLSSLFSTLFGPREEWTRERARRPPIPPKLTATSGAAEEARSASSDRDNRSSSSFPSPPAIRPRRRGWPMRSPTHSWLINSMRGSRRPNAPPSGSASG